MATHAGKEGKVKIGSNLVAETRNWNLTETGNTSDTTAMGTTAETHLFTTSSWEGAISCWWDETDTSGQGALTVGASVTFSVYPEGDSSGDTYYTGTATVTQTNPTASHDGVVEASFSFKGNGALTIATVS